MKLSASAERDWSVLQDMQYICMRGDRPIDSLPSYLLGAAHSPRTAREKKGMLSDTGITTPSPFVMQHNAKAIFLRVFPK